MPALGDTHSQANAQWDTKPVSAKSSNSTFVSIFEPTPINDMLTQFEDLEPIKVQKYADSSDEFNRFLAEELMDASLVWEV